MNKSTDLSIKRNIKIYDKIYNKYENKRDEIFNPIEQERLHKKLEQAFRWIKTSSNRKIALDYGCGSGNLAKHLINIGFHVVAVDVSDNFLRLVKQKYGNTGMLINTLKVNGQNLSNINDNYFDFIGAYSVLHHVPDYLHIIKEIIRVTKRGGIIYLDHEANESYWSRNKQYTKFVRLVSRPSFKKWRKYLTLSKYIKRIREIIIPWYQPEGDIHIRPDDHIEWGKIENLLVTQKCAIVSKEDYLLYKAGYPVDIYQEYNNRGCNDMRVLVARKS